MVAAAPAAAAKMGSGARGYAEGGVEGMDGPCDVALLGCRGLSLPRVGPKFFGPPSPHLRPSAQGAGRFDAASSLTSSSLLPRANGVREEYDD